MGQPDLDRALLKSSSVGANSGTARPRAIAPWWHTTVMVFLFALLAVMGVRNASAGKYAVAHLRHYSYGVFEEWAVAALAYWGIWLRKTPLRQLLGEKRTSVRAWFADLGFAAVFWLINLVAFYAVALPLARHHVSVSGKAAAQLAPANSPELALWVALSLSAGVCEEFIFRGYFQQQFASVNGKAWFGVVCSTLLFGGVHVYQGIGGALAIGAMGAVMSLLVILRRNLRPSMMMHASQDVFAGLAYFAIRHAHHR